MSKQIVLHERDNVFIALETTAEHMRGHKYARINILAGEEIIKYGMAIGKAIEDIPMGAHVHTHNTKTNLGDVIEYRYEPKFEDVSTPYEERTVRVYERYNQEVGIRNECWIIPTVGCVNGVAMKIIQRTKDTLTKAGYDLENLSFFDGMFTFSHAYGCSQMGQDAEHTTKTLQNIVKHPNAGGVLVLGLGCENNQISNFKATLGEYDQKRVRFLTSQDVEDEIEEGVKILTELFHQMEQDQRVEKPISVLRVGLECGGSDGLSGITANPLIGKFSDYLTSYGGTSVLTEVPEMFGAETILMSRCANEDIFNKTVNMVNGFKNYYKKHDQVIYENPSPGNKNGGITTLEDKSCGCTQKAGQSQVQDVLEMTDRIKHNGLNLISAPGNDAVATTVLGMCGCQMVLFSTGRGTPFGGFIPTVKIATNTELAQKKPGWIDFNAGVLVDGVGMEDLLGEFIDRIVDIANGEKTKQEINDYREIAIFKSGVTL